MKFHITYLGPMSLAHLRRDFILLLKYGIQEAGHAVHLGNGDIDANAINVILGGYFRTAQEMQALAAYDYIVVNTEPVLGGFLNGNPNKTNMPAYIEFMKGARAVWDVIPENIPHYEAWGIEARFLQWGYCHKLEDVGYNAKDLDWYFYGTMSKRRQEILATLPGIGLYDADCPYFVRNDRIGRAKVSLNIIQADKYTHVNSFRVCYLMQNRQCVLSEKEQDQAGYLEGAIVSDNLADKINELIGGDWALQAERGYFHMQCFAPQSIIMERLLDEPGRT